MYKVAKSENTLMSGLSDDSFWSKHPPHYLAGDNFAVAAISVMRICLSFGISLAFPTSMSTITTITVSISMIIGRIVWVMVVARSYRLSTNLFS